jgi:hypothetical protein
MVLNIISPISDSTMISRSLQLFLQNSFWFLIPRQLSAISIPFVTDGRFFTLLFRSCFIDKNQPFGVAAEIPVKWGFMEYFGTASDSDWRTEK